MTSSITVEPYETVEFSDSDTDSWQVVDPFDSDNDDVITTESDVVTSSDEGEDDDVDISDVISSESDVISSEDEDEDVITSEDEEDYVDEITKDTLELNNGYELKEHAYFERDEDEEDEEDEEDLDDELVPRWLNNKFERQRMRKLGKKVYPKMKKSKRMVNQYNRPGCAGAKHGLGLNNNLIW